jgi:hypothetical protein
MNTIKDWEDDYDKFMRIFGDQDSKRAAFNNYQKMYKREKYKTDEVYRNNIKNYMRDYYYFTKSIRGFNNNQNNNENKKKNFEKKEITQDMFTLRFE